MSFDRMLKQIFAEIRNLIYQYALYDPEPINFLTPHLGCPPLARVNKQVRAECWPMYFSLNTFDVCLIRDRSESWMFYDRHPAGHTNKISFTVHNCPITYPAENTPCKGDGLLKYGPYRVDVTVQASIKPDSGALYLKVSSSELFSRFNGVRYASFELSKETLSVLEGCWDCVDALDRRQYGITDARLLKDFCARLFGHECVFCGGTRENGGECQDFWSCFYAHCAYGWTEREGPIIKAYKGKSLDEALRTWQLTIPAELP